MKSEEEIFRNAILFWPASAETGIISGSCLKPNRKCITCGRKAIHGACPSCKRIIDKGGTP